MAKLFEITRSYQQLSNDFLNLLNQDETFDVILHVGEENNKFESFKAHSIILRTRSEYFKAALSNSWRKEKFDGYYHIDLIGLNIPLTLFEYILYYIYGGIVIDLDNLSVTEKLELLRAADVLMMDSFVDYLEQNLIIEGKSWNKTQASEVLFITLQISRCKNLLQACNNAILRNPKTFFSSKEFLFIPKHYLIKILDRDILGLEEIDIFAGVIMWGINNTPNLSHFDDFKLWTSDNVTSLKSTIIQFLNKIRFFHMQPEDFVSRVGPLIKIFSPELYEQVIQYHTKKSISNNENINVGNINNNNILPLRLNSLIIKEKEETSLISYWIDNLDDDKLKYNRDYEESIKLYEKYSMLPFNFHLIFRTNGNELKEETDTNNSIWKQYCHDQGPTLTVIRTKNINDDEVVFGGFKSVSWSNREDENVGGGGKGFIFGYLWQDDKLLLPWMLPVENHFHGDRILGDGQLLYIDFTNGNQLLAHANGWNLEATIEELEVFKVVRKNV